MSSLLDVCLVCGEPTVSHKHYGAVCCYSCRAFFRRSINQRFSCINGDNKCTIDKITRANCKSCRYNRCLEVGMKKNLVDINKHWRINRKNVRGSETKRSVDIDDIVDLCFEDEEKKKVDYETDKIITSNVISELKYPILCFTLEEELCIHELIVKREFMLDIIENVKNSSQSEQLRELVKITGIGSQRKVSYAQRLCEASMRLGQHISSTRFQDVYHEFSAVNKVNAYNCHFASFPALCTFFYTVCEATKDLSLVDQQRMIGCSEGSIARLLQQFPEALDMKGLGLENQSMFTSPWALSLEEEDFFTKSIREIGQILGWDIAVWSVYQSIIMVSDEDISDQEITRVKGELWLLLYRYMSSKIGAEQASKTVESLKECVRTLQRCGEILFFRMLWTDDAEEDSLELLESALDLDCEDDLMKTSL